MNKISLQLLKSGSKIEYLSVKLDNLLRLKQHLSNELYDSVISEANFDDEASLTIALQEIYYILRPGGTFQIPESQKSKELIKASPIARTRFVVSNVKGFFKFEKKNLSIENNGDICKWSFGVITNGKRKEFIEQFINSVYKQSIPHYEIFVCGEVSGLKEFESDKVKLIQFNQFDDKGWITKKKNIIVERCNYENICIIHDRYILSDDWFKNIKEYGNDFDILSASQYYNERRLADWVENKNTIANPHDINHIVNYKFWSPDIYLPGGVNIFKKYIIYNNPYNEELFWADKEDIELSRRHFLSGYVIRICDTARFEALFSHWKSPSLIGHALRKVKSVIYEYQYENNKK